MTVFPPIADERQTASEVADGPIGDYRERSALSIFTPNEQLCRSITDIGLKVLATPLYLD